MNAKIPLKREGLLDNGTYRLRVDDCELKKSQSGNDYLNMKYAVIVKGQSYGGAIWDVISLTPQSRFIVEQFLDAISAPNTEDSVSPQWFKGKFLYAALTTGEWKGKLRNEVDYYVAAGAAEAGEDSDDTDNEDEDEAPTLKRQTVKAPIAGKGRKVLEEVEEDFPV